MSTPSSDLMSANAGKSTTDSTITGSAGADPQTPHDQVFRLIMAAWGSQAVRTLASLSVAERQYSPTPLKHYAQAAIGPAFWPPALLLPEAVRQGSGQAVAAIGSDVFTYFLGPQLSQFTALLTAGIAPDPRHRPAASVLPDRGRSGLAFAGRSASGGANPWLSSPPRTTSGTSLAGSRIAPAAIAGLTVAALEKLPEQLNQQRDDEHFCRHSSCRRNWFAHQHARKRRQCHRSHGGHRGGCHRRRVGEGVEARRDPPPGSTWAPSRRARRGRAFRPRLEMSSGS